MIRSQASAERVEAKVAKGPEHGSAGFKEGWREKK
jgi:hypothetical protein